MGRNANGRSSIYQGTEGWNGRVTVGVKDDGTPDGYDHPADSRSADANRHGHHGMVKCGRWPSGIST